ncbi:MAG: hypothetical protein C5B48_10555 [Candidatus Rokuibacteriota bacterium]|nr:MAG: hypothetical protein C5B48_10555 [Candidatus Rokubacteria bacterium]
MSDWLPVLAQHIPAELQKLGCVLWRAEPVSGAKKARKVPYVVARPTERASSTDAATWASFDDAMAAYRAVAEKPDSVRGPVAGIAVCLTRDARISCVDLDGVIASSGDLDPRAATLVARLHSWTELSPSSRGLHVFVHGSLGAAIKRPGIEVYSEARMMCVTGWPWPLMPTDLQERQPLLDALAAALGPPVTSRQAWNGPSIPPPDDLAGALIAKLEAWGVSTSRIKRWSDGYLAELGRCPWADEHTTGPGGAAVIIHASGAYDFSCQHAHCGQRDWRDFRAVMEDAR